MAAGNPVVPLVKELTGVVGGKAARHVHEGATSQNIMDTAAMLVSRRAGVVILTEADTACARLGALAGEHRATLMAGRTPLQQALPTTFGAVTVGWLNGLGAAGKAAGDIVLLAQTETGEVTESGGTGVGSSSTPPHKRNPIAAMSAVACADQAPGLASTLFACHPQEHRRAAGHWHAEWLPLADLLRTTGSAVTWLGDSLDRLSVAPDRMRTNFDPRLDRRIPARRAGHHGPRRRTRSAGRSRTRTGCLP